MFINCRHVSVCETKINKHQALPQLMSMEYNNPKSTESHNPDAEEAQDTLQIPESLLDKIIDRAANHFPGDDLATESSN